ncbi:MAG: carboxypeptidase-like regulatory domain-containing protein, partial [Flavobacteriaceae bacterium]|nr:carboxypeptidase-like regulatory domain-containing protein [Flavobacteriaceae bacterium]
MTVFKKLNLLIVAFLMCQILEAQNGSLTGTLYDQSEQTVPFATVAVMKLPDSTVVTGTTTDIDGKFDLKPNYTGKYFLRFSAIGYSTVSTPGFDIKGPGFTKDFGSILMKEEMTMLNEVVLKTWRPKVKVENGKMVMRVAGTTLAAGNTAFEMLSRAPGVTVDQDGNFLINGNKGVEVMIDGRLTYLNSSELATLLEGMPAENIEEIEVITNPSAKYDAEGSAGILNITLKKNSLSGLNGSVYSGLEYGKQSLFTAGTNLNYKKGNWNSFFSLDLSERGQYRDAKVTRSFPSQSEFTTYEQTGVQTRKGFVPSIQLGTDYDINEN